MTSRRHAATLRAVLPAAIGALLTLTSPIRAEQAISAAAIRADVELLAHPAFRGREAGTPEASLAALILAQRFERLGLAGAGPGGAFLQPFAVQRLSFDQAGASLTVGAEPPVPQERGIFVELLAPPPANATETLPVVFAGWGIRAREPAHDDYAGIDARGKAVLVWAGEPLLEGNRSAFAPGRMSRYSFVATKAAAAAEAGAALLLVAAPPGGRPVEESWKRDRREKSRPRFVLPQAAPLPPVVYIGEELAARLFAAGGADPKALLAAAGVGRSPSRALGPATARLALPGFRAETLEQQNVVALLAGSDPRRANEPVVVAAHYDHIGADTGPDGALVVFPGADDNASGTAGVLAIAEALLGEARAGHGLPRPVVFAIFGAEEKGALGSRAYAGAPWPTGSRPAAVINLDMIGRNNGDRADYAQVVLASYTARATALSAILTAAAAGAGLELRKLPYLRPPGRSDDTSFAEQDLPAVMLFTGPHKDYNTPGDTAAALDAAKAARVASLATAAVRALAAHEGPLAWDRAMTEAPPSDPWDRPY
ncbi:MAG: M20/M25/M40 family metallo-hydrolase [Acidobacteria bacterium]|nr:M20/M25/M40 family metallo-hydrolase [Acidobacteriota bacterium]